jgi:hypothetical protein
VRRTPYYAAHSRSGRSSAGSRNSSRLRCIFCPRIGQLMFYNLKEEAARVLRCPFKSSRSLQDLVIHSAMHLLSTHWATDVLQSPAMGRQCFALSSQERPQSAGPRDSFPVQEAPAACILRQNDVHPKGLRSALQLYGPPLVSESLCYGPHRDDSAKARKA